jgi:hypothetical protein
MDHVEDQPILVELVVHLDTLLEAVEDQLPGHVLAQEEDRVRVVVLRMRHVHYLVLIQVEPYLGDHAVHMCEQLLLFMEEVPDHLQIQPEDM